MHTLCFNFLFQKTPLHDKQLKVCSEERLSLIGIAVIVDRQKNLLRLLVPWKQTSIYFLYLSFFPDELVLLHHNSRLVCTDCRCMFHLDCLPEADKTLNKDKTKVTRFFCQDQQKIR